MVGNKTGGILSWMGDAPPSLSALRSQAVSASYSGLLDLVGKVEKALVESQARGIICNENKDLQKLIAWAAAAQARGIPCIIGGGVLTDDELFRLTPRQPFSHRCDGMRLLPIEARVTTDFSEARFGSDAVVLLTSGTAGEPKLAVQTWRGISASVRRGDSLRRKKWLLTYSPTRFAGIQVWLHSLANEGLLIYSETLAVSALIELLAEHKPEMISGTPTFWRQVLRSMSSEELVRCKPRVITLGGEAADRPLLDTLRQLFSDTRIVQIYASTEAGVGVSVDDGQEGLPASVLRTSYNGNEFKIVDGELLIKSASQMSGYIANVAVNLTSDGFVGTGDLFEQCGDRILFRGRKDGRFNVGGHKVDPTEIERHALAVSGVALAQAYARRSPILGEIPVLRFVVSPGFSSSGVTEALRNAFKDFPPYKIPRMFDAVSELDTTDTGKIKRTL